MELPVSVESRLLSRIESHPLMPKAAIQGVYVLYIEDDALVSSATQALLLNHGALCEYAGSLEQLLEGVIKSAGNP
jgi:hypothetical protein